MQNSTQTLERLEHALDDVKKKLFDQLHEAVRQQIFPLHAVDQADVPPRRLPAPSSDSESEDSAERQ